MNIEETSSHCINIEETSSRCINIEETKLGFHLEILLGIE